MNNIDMSYYTFSNKGTFKSPGFFCLYMPSKILKNLRRKFNKEKPEETHLAQKGNAHK